MQAFFDLAQANRDKSASGGSRVDESGYDQRMQALRRMSNFSYNLMADDISRIESSDSEDAFLLRNFSKENTSDENDEVKLIDPLRWYGVLAPQSLKDAQARFVQGEFSSLNRAER